MLCLTCCSSREHTFREISSGIAGRAGIDWVKERHDVAESIRHNGSVVVFAEAVDERGNSLATTLRGHWNGAVDVPVVAIVRPDVGEVAQMAAIVRAGAAELLLLGHDNAWNVLTRVIDERLQTSSWTRWLGALNADAMLFLVDCMSEVRRGANAETLARSLGLSVSSLHRRCRNLYLPSPGKLVRWLRVLATLEEVRGARAPLSQVALRCGYSSAATMRLAFEVLLGVTPSEARAVGVIDRAIEDCQKALFCIPNADGEAKKQLRRVSAKRRSNVVKSAPIAD